MKRTSSTQFPAAPVGRSSTQRLALFLFGLQAVNLLIGVIAIQWLSQPQQEETFPTTNVDTKHPAMTARSQAHNLKLLERQSRVGEMPRWKEWQLYRGMMLSINTKSQPSDVVNGLKIVMAKYSDRFVVEEMEGSVHRPALAIQFRKVRKHKGVKHQVAVELLDGTPTLGFVTARVDYSKVGDAIRALGHILVCAYMAPFGPLISIMNAKLSGMEKPPQLQVDMMGVKLDTSRGGVPTVSHLTDQMTFIAMCGYTTVLLYMEDTYEVESEPFFGHLRGRYSHAELNRVAEHGRALGLEVVPGIQVLGHLEQVLHWPAFSGLRDTANVMLAADDDHAFTLVEKMIEAVTSALGSTRIHLGLDETFGLGEGKYSESRCKRVTAHECLHPPDPATIFQTHIRRVLQLCGTLGLRPMLYSDMILKLLPTPHGEVIKQDEKRFAHRSSAEEEEEIQQEEQLDAFLLTKAQQEAKQAKAEADLLDEGDVAEEEEEEYGDRNAAAASSSSSSSSHHHHHSEHHEGPGHKHRSAEAIRRAWVNSALGDQTLDIVGWDYSSSSPEYYEERIMKHAPLLRSKRHFAFSFGLWTWNRFWAALPFVMDHLDAGIAAVNRTGVSQVYVSMWLDDGSEVAPVSAYAGLCYFATLVKNMPGEALRGDIKMRAEHTFNALAQQGITFTDVLETAQIDSAPSIPTGWGTTNTAKWMLWEDPLLPHVSPQVADKDMAFWHQQLADRLEAKMRLTGGQAVGSPERLPHPLGLPTALARVLSFKKDLQHRLLTAYLNRDTNRLAALIGLEEHVAYESNSSMVFLTNITNTTKKNTTEYVFPSLIKKEEKKKKKNETEYELVDKRSEVEKQLDKFAKRLGRSWHEQASAEGGFLGLALGALEALRQEHYALWTQHYKPMGWEILEMRYGGQRARLERVGQLVEALLLGEVSVIQELEEASRLEKQPMYPGKLYTLPLMCWARASTPAFPSVKSDTLCPL